MRCRNYMPSSISESQDVSDFIAHGWLQSAKLTKGIHSTIFSQLLSYCCHLWCLVNPSRADLIHEHWTANDDSIYRVFQSAWICLWCCVYSRIEDLVRREWCWKGSKEEGDSARPRSLPGSLYASEWQRVRQQGSNKATQPTEETFKRMRSTILACCCL